MKACWEASVDPGVKLVDIPPPAWLKSVNV
jgi:hypothetical protein